MPAEKRGFCRNSAASKVDPERGRPEMKWRRLPIARIMRVQVLADKAVDGGERAERIGDHAFIAHDQQAVRLLAIHRLTQRIVGEAEHAAADARPSTRE